MVEMDKICIHVTGEAYIADAARKARKMAEAIGFSTVQSHYIATAASELAANLWIHAGGGVFEVAGLCRPGMDECTGLEMIATDCGPGIVDISLALQDGYSTAGGLGCGLPGAQRLMDELHIDSRVGEGTVVRACKWR